MIVRKDFDEQRRIQFGGLQRFRPEAEVRTLGGLKIDHLRGASA